MGPRSISFASALLMFSSSAVDNSSRSKPAQKLPPRPCSTAQSIFWRDMMHGEENILQSGEIIKITSSCSKSSKASARRSAVAKSTQFLFSDEKIHRPSFWDDFLAHIFIDLETQSNLIVRLKTIDLKGETPKKFLPSPNRFRTWSNFCSSSLVGWFRWTWCGETLASRSQQDDARRRLRLLSNLEFIDGLIYLFINVHMFILTIAIEIPSVAWVKSWCINRRNSCSIIRNWDLWLQWSREASRGSQSHVERWTKEEHYHNLN